MILHRMQSLFAACFALCAAASTASMAQGCPDVFGKELNEAYTIDYTKIEKCILMGYDPPVSWRPDYGREGYFGEGGAVTVSGKCPPGMACPGYNKAISALPLGVFPPLPGSGNPNLALPPVLVAANSTIPPLPCGGSAGLNLSQIISSGMSIGSNIALGNISNAVSGGMGLLNNILSPCSGGLINMIAGTLNLILPPNMGVNVSGGVASTPIGAALMLPAGFTLDITPGPVGLTLPMGGSITSGAGTFAIPLGLTVLNFNGSAVTLSNGTSLPVSGALTLSPGNPSTGGSIILPEGTKVPMSTAPINTAVTR